MYIVCLSVALNVLCKNRFGGESNGNISNDFTMFSKMSIYNLKKEKRKYMCIHVHVYLEVSDNRYIHVHVYFSLSFYSCTVPDTLELVHL